MTSFVTAVDLYWLTRKLSQMRQSKSMPYLFLPPWTAKFDNILETLFHNGPKSTRKSQKSGARDFRRWNVPNQSLM